MQLRAVASPDWGPDREKLRAFCVALVQAKMCYGVTVVRYFAVGPRAAGQGAGTGGTRSGGYSQSRKWGGCPARGAAEADQRGSAPEGVGILPSPEGQGPDTREGLGQHLPT
ncbi:hypothetical protein ERJ75_000566400 [Trypanosoma vivax]|nr:hypothetical protein ERJ75_000566400 [Trypanosoma vivax]